MQCTVHTHVDVLLLANESFIEDVIRTTNILSDIRLSDLLTFIESQVSNTLLQLIIVLTMQPFDDQSRHLYVYKIYIIDPMNWINVIKVFDVNIVRKFTASFQYKSTALMYIYFNCNFSLALGDPLFAVSYFFVPVIFFFLKHTQCEFVIILTIG